MLCPPMCGSPSTQRGDQSVHRHHLEAPTTGPFYPQNMTLFVARDIEGRREIPSPWDSHGLEQHGWGPRRSPFMPPRKMMAFPCSLMESFSNSYPPAEPHCTTVLLSSFSVQIQLSPSSPFSPSPPPLWAPRGRDRVRQSSHAEPLIPSIVRVLSTLPRKSPPAHSLV